MAKPKRPAHGWYYRHPTTGESTGPVRRGWLQGQLTTRRLPGNVPVWHLDTDRWLPAWEHGFATSEQRPMVLEPLNATTAEHAAAPDRHRGTGLAAATGFYGLVRRGLARGADAMVLGAAPAVWLLAYLASLVPDAAMTLRAGPAWVAPLVAYLSALFISVVLEAASTAAFGHTPGKWLLGIRVGDAAGRRLPIAAALHRAVLASAGAGGYIPPITLGSLLWCGFHWLQHHTLPWDVTARQVTLLPWSHWRWLPVLLIAWGMSAVLVALSHLGAL
jgi:uncharacterized RDD family membrane protein YckC